jgi:ATP-binding cassette subfamily B protein
MVAIALTGLVLLETGRPALQVLPSLALLALAAQRLLPLSQQIWTGWASLTAAEPLLASLLELLEWPEPLDPAPAAPLRSWRRVALEAVRFAHEPGAAPLLCNFNLDLARGEWLGLTGPSGAGKSTVVDLLLGLLTPEAGRLSVDGQPLEPGSERLRRWQASLAHVGSVVPLQAGDVALNVRSGATAAGLAPAELTALAELTGLTALLQRPVGETGRSLSGGQRQRLGLARALAAPLTLLVLDEATACLDGEAEAAILRRLRQRQPDLAVLLVSHREASLKLCDRVVHLERPHG